MEPVGKCLTMCPKEEFLFRKKHKLLHVLEQCTYSEGNVGHAKACYFHQVNINTCIKEFRRSAAGENICDPISLRPSHVLINTVDYLLTHVLQRKDVPFSKVYDFIFDRLRSVRQDAVIQQLEVKNRLSLIKILEQCIKFYLYAAHKVKLNPVLNIDGHINATHTKDCMASLLQLYSPIVNTVEKNQINDCLSTVTACLLLHINSSEVISTVLHTYPRWFRQSAPVSTAIKMCSLYSSNNWIGFNKLSATLAKERQFLPLYALSTIIGRSRENCIKMLCHSHHSKFINFSAMDLCRWLFIKRVDDALAYCSKSGLTTCDNAVKFFKADFKPCVSNGCMRSCCVSEALSNHDLLRYFESIGQ